MTDPSIAELVAEAAASDHTNVRVAEAVAERERGGRVDVRHLVARARAAPRGRSTAARPGSRGTLTGRRPLGFTRPLSTPAIAPVPSSPAKNVCTIAAATSGAARRARTADRRAASRTVGVPVVEHRVEQLPAARRAASSDSASQPSPLVPRPNRPARSPSASTTTSAGCRGQRASSNPSVSPPSTRRAARVARPRRPGNSAAERLEQRRAARCRVGTSGCCDADVRRERVAAEHGVRVVARSGRSPRSGAGAASGSVPSLRQQHDRLLGELGGRARGSPAESRSTRAAQRRRPCVEVDAARAPAGTGDQSASSRPSSAFCRSTRRSARSMSATSTAPVVDRARAAAAPKRLDGRQLDVDARRRAPPRPPSAQSSAVAVQLLEEARSRSSRRRPCPRSPRSSRSSSVSSAAIGRRRDAVEVGVRVHHRAHAALADRHLERRQQHVGELARSDRDRREVAPALRGRVADEVLERRDDAGGLEPAT